MYVTKIKGLDRDSEDYREKYFKMIEILSNNKVSCKNKVVRRESMRCKVAREIIMYALRYDLYSNNDIDEVTDNILYNKQLFTEDSIKLIKKELNEYGKEDEINLINKEITKYSSEQNILNRVYMVGENILFKALKYAMGRMTFAPITVIDNILFNIKEGVVTKEFIDKSLKFIECTGYFGMGMDKKTWLDFKDELEKLN